MADLKVVPLRTKPPLGDIPGLLRSLADDIDAGAYPDCETMFVVMPMADAYPRLWGWGDVDGKRDPAIQLALAHHMLLGNLVAR